MNLFFNGNVRVNFLKFPGKPSDGRQDPDVVKGVEMSRKMREISEKGQNSLITPIMKRFHRLEMP